MLLCRHAPVSLEAFRYITKELRSAGQEVNILRREIRYVRPIGDPR